MIIVFFPLLNVGFTTADDAVDHYMNIVNPNANLVRIARGIAESQARFQYFFVYLLSLFPYLFIKNFLLFKIISLSQIILNFLLMSWLAYKLTKSKPFSLSILVFLITFLQNSWFHNLLTSYPFIFSFGMNLSLGSLIFFVDYLKNKSKSKLFISLFLFLLSLFNYEIFVLYLSVFFLISIFLSKNSKLHEKVWESFKNLKYHLTILFSFLAVYIIYRLIYPGVYDGTHSFSFDASRIIRTAIQFVISSFPTYIYRFSIGEILNFSYTKDRAIQNFAYIMSNVQLAWLIKGLISSTIAFYLIKDYKEIKNKVLYFIAFLSVVFMFLPVLPQSFVNKYQEWAINAGQIAFTPTFFSFFGTILLIVTSMYLFTNKFKNKYLRIFIALIVSFIVFRFSIITDYSNYFYTLDQSQVFNVWTSVEKLIKTTDFAKLPPGSILYAPTIYKYTDRIIVKDSSNFYWSSIIASKTGKNIKFITDIDDLKKVYEKNNENVYYLGFSQEAKDPNVFMVLSKIKSIDSSNHVREKLIGDEFTVFTLSKYKKYKIIYESNKHVEEYNVSRDLEMDPLVKTKISKNNVDLQTITVTHYLDSLPPIAQMQYTFGEGFYNEEMDNENSFRWSKGKSEINITNTDEGKIKKIHFKVSSSTGKMADLHISGDLLSQNLKISETPIEFTEEIFISQGNHKVVFSSNAEKLTTQNDTRDLRFKIINFSIYED